jgi:protein gp37
VGDKTKIEWSEATWTPIRAFRDGSNGSGFKIGWHCEHVSPGCEGCYAESINKRLGTGLPFKPGHRKDVRINIDDKMLTQPLRWKRPRMIFVCSMTDLFADFVTDAMIDKVFAVMALAPQHTFQVLTKRAERMRSYFTEPHTAPNIVAWQARVNQAIDDLVPLRTAASVDAKLSVLPPRAPLSNVWLGVSAEDQERADERIPHLLATPAKVRFLSAEPLLGPIKLWGMDPDACALRGVGVVIDGKMTASTADYPAEGIDTSYPGLDWVIVGGESGPKARPMHPQWARDLRDQCQAASVAFFMKQMAKKAEIPIDLFIREMP